MAALLKLRPALVAAALACAVCPASAAAGVISTRTYQCDKTFYCSDTTFTADPGEANDITVAQSPAGLVLRDDGATLRGSGNLRPDLANLVINTGDGNDRVVAPHATIDLGPGDDLGRGTTVRGGPGDDVIIGDSGQFESSTELDGGPGADTITGGPGDDHVVASDVDAATHVDVPAPDSIDGGPGRNQVTYRGRGLPVTVDLAVAGPQGVAGEGDTLVNVRSVEGGGGDDVLRGDGGPNLLYGGQGNDLLDGRDGNDLLIGGAGFDRLAGGAGDDELDAVSQTGNAGPQFGPQSSTHWPPGPDADSEPLDCGPGTDSVVRVNGDIVDKSCETTGRFERRIDPFPRIARHGLGIFALPCPRGLRFESGCSGRLDITDVSDDDGASTTRRFRLPLRGGTVSLTLPGAYGLRVPVRRDLYLRVTVRLYGRWRQSDPSRRFALRYVIKVPAGCTRPARCDG